MEEPKEPKASAEKSVLPKRVGNKAIIVTTSEAQKKVQASRRVSPLDAKPKAKA